MKIIIRRSIMKNELFQIEGMSCPHCAMAVKKELAKLNLDHADVTVGQAEVEYDESKVTKNQIIHAIEAAGYRVV
jgi:copper chaperone